MRGAEAQHPAQHPGVTMGAGGHGESLVVMERQTWQFLGENLGELVVGVEGNL